MFHLTKILNARTNVPEPARISLTAPVTVRYGTPVILAGGTLSVMGSTATALPTHLILADATNAREVLATPITEEMIFEVRASAAPSAMTLGTEYLLTAEGDGVSAVAVSSGKRGATLMDKTGAHAIGDTLLVAFRN